MRNALAVIGAVDIHLAAAIGTIKQACEGSCFAPAVRVASDLSLIHISEPTRQAAPLTGLLYCADCGGKMYVHRTNNGKRISQYTCSQYTKVPCGTLCKTQHRINEDVVLSLVSEMLKAIAEYTDHTGGRDLLQFCRAIRSSGVWRSGADPRGIRRNPQA